MQGAEKHQADKREAIRYKEEQDKIDAERRKQMKAGDAKDFQKLIQDSDVIRPAAVV